MIKRQDKIKTLFLVTAESRLIRELMKRAVKIVHRACTGGAPRTCHR